MPDSMERYSLLPSTRAMPMSQILAVPCRDSRMLAVGWGRWGGEGGREQRKA